MLPAACDWRSGPATTLEPTVPGGNVRPARAHLKVVILALAAIVCPLLPGNSAHAAGVDPGVRLVLRSSRSLAAGVILTRWDVTNPTTSHRSTCYVLRASIGAGATLKVPGLVTSGRWPLIGTANTSGIFAAVNGDYFDYGTGAPLHPWIQNGVPMMLTSSPMGVVGTGTDGIVRDADVWLDGRVVSARKSYSLAGVNTPFSPARPTMYTPRWGLVSRPFARGAIEVVVRRNKVVAVHAGITAAPVPADGIIVDGPQAIMGIPAIGSPVYTAMAIRTTAPAPFRSAIGHGLRLISGGSVNDWGAGDPSARPRTAVGIVAATRTLLLTACQGDDSTAGGYNGLGDNELTSFLRHSGLGATTAVLLDGGGSTTLAARLPGSTGMSYVVTPAGNAYTRPTADAIGITVP